MHHALPAGLVAVALAGCVAAPPASPPPGAPPTQAAAPSALTVFATPLLILAKIPVCVGTVAIAAPLAAANALAPPNDTDARDLRRVLDAGVVANCGPPYVVTTP